MTIEKNLDYHTTTNQSTQNHNKDDNPIIIIIANTDITKRLPCETKKEYSDRIKKQLIELQNFINKNDILVDVNVKITFSVKSKFWRFLQ